MKYESLMPFDVKLVGYASGIVESDLLPKAVIALPVFSDGVVNSMPEPKEGVLYVVNNVIFPHLKDRNDVVAFDHKRTVRNDKVHVTPPLRSVNSRP